MPSEAERRKQLEASIDYLYQNLPGSMVDEYARTRTSIDEEMQRAGSLRRELGAEWTERLRQHPDLHHGDVENKVYQAAATRAADSVVETLIENDILFVSRRAWQPYRRRQEKFFGRIQEASPKFLDDFQLHLNSILQPHRRTLKLIRRETLVDFIVDRKSRGAPVCLNDFITGFKAVSKTLPPTED